jgi:hypothetical protein
MRVTLYSEKSVTECYAALNERYKGSTKFSGAVDKSSGHFTLITSSKLVWDRFERRTCLRGHVEKGEGGSVVHCTVPSGLPQDRVWLVIGACVLTGVVTFLGGQALFGILIALAGFGFYIPFTGDRINGEVLYSEAKRLLKARESAPRSATPAAKSNAPARPANTAQALGAAPSPLGANRTTEKKGRGRK